MRSEDYQPTSQLPADSQDAWPVEAQAEDTIDRSIPPGAWPQRYQPFRPAQQGGFGIVYFVSDQQTGQDYAVKTCRAEQATYPDVERFKAEIDFWLNLEPYPHIVKAHFVEVVDGQPYLFMEYVDGGAHPDLASRLKAAGGRLGVEQAVDFAYQLCLGMEFANRKGEVVHGDLKPQNLLIDRNNQLKVTDFGTAELIRVVEGAYPRSTRSTWEYAPPEMILEQLADNRADIFALGMILCEMLMGRETTRQGTKRYPYPLFLSHDIREMYQQLQTFHKQHSMRQLCQQIYYDGIPGVPQDLSIIVSGCLSDDMSERFRDFTRLRNELERAFNLKPPVAGNQASAADLHRHALSLHRIGRYHEALNLFNRLLLQHPADGQLWLDAAETLQAAGFTIDAQEFRERAADLDPPLQQRE
ncbi:MAG TPA: protein kinase [Ktedonobacteraceae bacterium]|jgi:serine/threonine protein kinase